MKLRFAWDEEKAKANLKKHRVSFEEATTVFLDPFSMTIPDPDHSWKSNGLLTLEVLIKVVYWQ